MKPISKSIQLASVALHAALCIVRDSGGSMKASQVNEAVEKIAPKNNYAQTIIESNGMSRWRMFMQFFSIDAVKAGYLDKAKGVWRVTEAGILALNKSPLDFLLDAQTAYKG